jgi:hypothetical protein
MCSSLASPYCAESGDLGRRRGFGVCGGRELPLSVGSDFLLRVRVSPMYAGERS